MAGRAIIFVMTYVPDIANGKLTAVRQTWAHQHPEIFPIKYIFDRTHKDPWPDELVLDAPIGLLNTSFKTQKAAEWALEHGYDHAFFVPTDCYVALPRLLTSGYEKHDYTGFHSYDEHHIGGGSGYWLSRRALQVVAGYKAYPDYEDRWVGSACKDAGISAVHDQRYRSWEQPPVKGAITKHLSHGTNDYDPIWMFMTHEQYLREDDLT